MMLTGSSTSPFAPIESAVHNTLFAGRSAYAALTSETETPAKERTSVDNASTAKRNSVTSAAKESIENNGAAGRQTPGSPKAKGERGSANAEEQLENAEGTSCKKTN